MLRTRVVRALVPMVILGMDAGVPESAGAQVSLSEPRGRGFIVAPSLGIAGVADDNLFFRPGNAEGAFYGRISPGVTATLIGRTIEIEAGYSFDAEKYPERFEDLTRLFSRQDARVGLGYRPTRRASVTVDAGYLSTHEPGELIEDSGLEFARQPSSGYWGSFELSSDVKKRQELKVGYEYSANELGRDEVTRLGRNTANVVWAGWTHDLTPRNRIQVEYRFRSFANDFATIAGSGTSQSHSLVAGFLWELNRRTQVSVRIGPRLSRGRGSDPVESPVLDEVDELTPEVFASIEYDWRKSTMSLVYAQSQNQSLGVTSFFDTRSVSLELGFRPRRSVYLSVSPGAFWNSRAGIGTRTYRADVEARFQVSKWIGIRGYYGHSTQDGRLTPATVPLPETETTRNVLVVGMTLGKSFRVN